jgi:hypothetical protein
MKQGYPLKPYECSSTYHDSTIVHIKINIALEEDGNPLVDSEYTITGPGLLCHPGLVPQLCCPHQSLRFDIQCLRSGCRPEVSSNAQLGGSATCAWCETSLLDVRCKLNEATGEHISYSFRTTRRLGKADCYADKTWHGQSDLALELFDPEEQMTRRPWSLCV